MQHHVLRVLEIVFVRFYSVRVIMYIKMVGIFVKFWHTCPARVTVYQMSIQ